MKTTNLEPLIVTEATLDDAAEIFALQKLAYQSEAEIEGNFGIPPLTETLDQIEAAFGRGVVFKSVLAEQIIGSARTIVQNGTCHVCRVIVHPELQNRGIGSQLMLAVETRFPDVRRFELFTSQKSGRNLHFYAKLGYQPYKTMLHDGSRTMVYLEKLRDSAA